MFQSLHIQGYRRFKDYRLENLARVNLLVGDNNSGKTSVLEAVQLLTLNDAHAAFTKVAERRGEQVYRSSDRNQDEGRWYPTVANCITDTNWRSANRFEWKPATMTSDGGHNAG